MFTSNQLRFGDYDAGSSVITNRVTSAVYRDTSAWMHIVLAIDYTSSQAKIYVNGVEVTAFDTSVGPSNVDGGINASGVTHAIGQQSSGLYFDGYLANIHFIDGQALTPSSFTETDATTGQLIPKTYTGSYGTNGFNLLFADNSSNTASTLGKDYSGLGNNWTPNNLSVTAGAGNDSLVDSPTNYGTDTGVGGEVRGNYATLNPLDPAGGYPLTLANGNLETTAPSSQWRWSRATWALTSGKWYWEHTVGSGNYFSGVVTPSWDLNVTSYTGMYGRQSTDKYNNGTTTSPFSSTTGGDILMYALDVDSGNMWVGKNGTWNGSGDPGAGTNPDWTGVPIGVSPFAAAYQVTNILNFGQRAFAYTNNRTGFKALCTQNLPTPLVTKSNTVFDVVTRAGGGTTQTFATLRPGLVWEKRRDSSSNHYLFDVNRGNDNYLSSNLTSAEAASAGAFTFNTNSYIVSSGFDWPGGATVVDWVWDAGTSTVSNTQGSITSQVRANATAGFSVVTYTGNNTANATFGHGLGVTPEFVIIKKRSSTGNWIVYHKGMTSAAYYMYLNATDAQTNQGGAVNTWGVSSTLITLKELFGDYNASGATYVSYCFAPVVGYSSFGSYVGNGSSDGPMVYTGFRPRFLLYKSSSLATYWVIYDAVRDTYNGVSKELYPNDSLAEGVVPRDIDFLSNGFKIRNTGSTDNTSSATYIYAAFAEAPFNYSRAR
jgi:hypothetical protein